MNVYTLLEPVIVAAVLLLSAWTVLGTLAPRLRGRMVALVTGRRSSASVAADCGSGCGSCRACPGGRAAPTRHEQPIRFQR